MKLNAARELVWWLPTPTFIPCHDGITMLSHTLVAYRWVHASEGGTAEGVGLHPIVTGPTNNIVGWLWRHCWAVYVGASLRYGAAVNAFSGILVK